MKISNSALTLLLLLPSIALGQTAQELKDFNAATDALWKDLIEYDPTQPQLKLPSIQSDLKNLNAFKAKFPATPPLSSRFNIALDRTKKWDFNHPLIFMMSRGLYSTAKPYIEKDTGLFDPSFPDKDGKSHWSNIAANLNGPAILALIKDFKMPLKVPDRLSLYPEAESTLLHYAVHAENKATVEALLKEFPTLIDEVDGSKNTALHLAVQRSGATLTGILAKANPKNVNALNASLSSPLHGAALFGSLETVNVLLANGADPSLRNSDGYSPLDYAVGTNKQDAIISALKEDRRNKEDLSRHFDGGQLKTS